MKTLLMVDLSYQVYRSTAANPMLTSRRVFTGGLYGFMMIMGKMVRELRPTLTVFCRDSKPYVRSKEYPDYKMLRKKNADEELLKLYKQSEILVLEVLQAMGCAIWAVPGFEVDDLVAHAGIKYRHRYDEIWASSNDSDLYQLLDIPNFHLYTTGVDSKGKEREKLKTLGLTPTQFHLATAMTGTHNDVEGIPKCGPVTAAKAIRDPALMRNFRAIYGSLIDRNLQLIKLPHKLFPASAVLPTPSKDFDERNLYRLLGRYDIDVTQAMVNALNPNYEPR